MSFINYAYQQKKLIAGFEQKSKLVRVKSKPAEKIEKAITIEDVPSAPALLKIPKIGLQTAVVEGTTAAALAKGPGFIEKTARPGTRGNIAISGHRTMYGAPFKRLNELDSGDQIILEVPGFELIYTTTEMKKVKPTNTSVLDDFGDNRLTLTTCDPIFSARFRLAAIGILNQIKVANNTNE